MKINNKNKNKNKNKKMMATAAAVAAVFLLLCWKLLGSAPKPGHPQVSAGAGRSAELFREDGSAANVLDIVTRVPDSEDLEHVILLNKTEAARFKTRDGEIFDKTGVIPGGKIRFVNDFEKTYGVANYADENLDGEFLEYYANGQLKTRAVYSAGKMQERKIYFEDGKIFSEEDLSKTTFVSAFTRYSRLKNIGTGKIYRFNGTVKYEWHATDEDEKFYAKYFNTAGDLREAFYYDKSGALLEHWTPAAAAAPAGEAP